MMLILARDSKAFEEGARGRQWLASDSVSELWDMHNVVMTPHMANTSPREEARAATVFEDNLARFVSGEPLRNLMDPELGY